MLLHWYVLYARLDNKTRFGQSDDYCLHYSALQYVELRLKPLHNWPFSIHPLWKSNFLSFTESAVTPIHHVLEIQSRWELDPRFRLFYASHVTYLKCPCFEAQALIVVIPPWFDPTSILFTFVVEFPWPPQWRNRAIVLESVDQVLSWWFSLMSLFGIVKCSPI